MKVNLGTLIEEEVIGLAKRRAAEEGRSLSDMIQEALIQYLSAGAVNPKERALAYQLFCERPLKLHPLNSGKYWKKMRGTNESGWSSWRQLMRDRHECLAVCRTGSVRSSPPATAPS